MDGNLTIATILVLGSTLIAILSLGSRVTMVHALRTAQRRCSTLADELARVRKSSDERQAHDGETISRLNNRTVQQGQMLRSLQDDLDKFITQHRAMVEVQARSDRDEAAATADAAAAEQRERAIRERLRTMLNEFRAVTGGIAEAEPHGEPAKAA
ncbi:MAG: hypothetical protein KF787_11865 [Phycisphaeraceae bacterium]|nr:hypothetical protein [Phycisphaerae bacterium]MBX3393331.1 hypothetical protein [Phycisphaeraceae bacterium]HRJ49857.1 hypothetical protein [Phycisphaerales bacterium]